MPLKLKLFRNHRFFFTLLILASVTSGCAIAPFSDPISPQTLGKGNQSHNITAGYPYIGYSFNMGVADSVDLGLQMESQIKGFAMGTRLMIRATEYSEDSWSGSLLGAAGLTTEGAYVYGGMVWGRKFGFYELTLVPRFNYTNISRPIKEEVRQDFEDLYSINFTERGDYFYTTLTVNNTFWFRPTFGFSLSVGGAYLFPWGDSRDSKFAAPYGGIGLTVKN